MSTNAEKNVQQKQQQKNKNAKKQPSSPQQEAIEKTSTYVRDFFYIVSEDGKVVEPRFDPELLALDCGIVIVLLASACWAASIAAARRHNAFVSFLLGLLLPWIYPLVILFAMNIPGKWDIAKQKREKEQAEVNALVEEAEKNDLQPDENGVIPYEPTPAYFNKIARKADGTPAGPWKVSFNGNLIIVTAIIEVLPEALSVEFHQPNKNDILKMRIPFSKIESWETIEEELA